MRTADVVVIGSGAAGLSAALSARLAGADVCLLEKASVIGGTSAMSGGVMWVPGHKFGGTEDTTSAALEYLRRATRGEVEDGPLEAYLADAPELLEFLERNTTLQLRGRSDHPDYLSAEIGGRTGRGVEPQEWDSGLLGDNAADVRQSPSGWRDALLDVEKKQLAVGEWRAGRALVGALLQACLAVGVDIITQVRATRLEMRDERVVGVQVDTSEGEAYFGATGGVVLASGGFEWNPTLVQAFLGVPLVVPVSAPSNTGDGLQMAMAVGSKLGNMSQAWWTPATRVSDSYYDDGPLNRFVTQERSKPGSIVVDRSGKRFVRETLNYNDFGYSMSTFDAASYQYSHTPAFLVFDEHCRKSYVMVGVEPADPTPGWMVEADSLQELAEKLGIDPAGLGEQVARYNEDAEHRIDSEFDRGSTDYERYAGDPAHGGNGTIRPLGAGPYFGIKLQLGALGTKGGPVTDLQSRVLRTDGTPIAGLFAAGNVTASIMGASYPGPGVTLGPAMVGGLRAGRAASATTRARPEHASQS